MLKIYGFVFVSQFVLFNFVFFFFFLASIVLIITKKKKITCK